MLFENIFAEFAKQSPVSVMVQVTMENVLNPTRLDELFVKTSVSQYTRELTFSSLADLMGSVVIGTHKSVHAAYQKSSEELGVSVTAVYDKLQRVEPEVSANLVRQTAGEMAEIIGAMPGGQAEALLAGYRTKILDGNCLGATEHRIFELRRTAAGPLPGKSLVVLDPRLQLAIDVFPCEDGHAQERSLLDQVLETVAANDLWIADRNFCTNSFLCGIARRLGYFLIRLHKGLAYEERGAWREIGLAETGYAFERPVRILDEDGQWRTLRLIRLNLSTPTRDGDDEMHFLTNLPESAASAIVVADLYRERWLLETAFLPLTQALNCEISTLGYPKAALFGFCMALVAYNTLAVTRAALRATWGAQAGDKNVSTYYLADEIAGIYRGMMIAIPTPAWLKFQRMTASQIAEQLLALAKNVKLRSFKKHPRGPKKPRPPRTSDPKKPHVSTKRLLDARKTK
jgi:IS4 transposase